MAISESLCPFFKKINMNCMMVQFFDGGDEFFIKKNMKD